jgi:hypothetical protein
MVQMVNVERTAEIQVMNKQHKEETINKIIMALGDDIGSTFLNRLKPLLDLAYEASYNQAYKDATERQSTNPIPEQWWNPRIVKPVDINKGCPVCDMGADGKAYGYVCNRSDCPTRVTC